MNIPSSHITLNRKLYDIENFKQYHNFYTLMQNDKKTIQRVYNVEEKDLIINRFVRYETLVIYKDVRSDVKPSFIVLGIKKNIKPIFGHFATNENYFIYTDVNKITYKPLYNIQYLKNPLENLIKPINSTYYKFTDIEDLKQSYLIIKNEELEKYKENIKENLEHIITEDLFNKSLYIYENEKIQSFINSDFLRIYLYGKEITL